MVVTKRFPNRIQAAIFLSTCVICSAAVARQLPSRNQGGMDGDVPTPAVAHSSTGVSNTSALAELQAYATAAGSAAWKGMHASGTTVYADSSKALPTTLNMLPNHRVRLVVTTPKGDSVTVVNGERGHVQYAGGSDTSLSAHTVAGGVAPFDLPGLVALHPEGYTILDLGTLNLGGESLHGVSIQADLHSSDGITGEEKRSAIDFYFDPATHLLRKSAVLITLPGAGLHRFLRVLTYADYKISGSSLVPSSIAETLDGQATWTLQLTAIDTTSLPLPATF